MNRWVTFSCPIGTACYRPPRVIGSPTEGQLALLSEDAGHNVRVVTKMHEPLSQRLRHFLEASSTGGSITLNRVIAHTEGRGIYLIIILLALPFIVPVSLPGFSTLMGLIIAFLCARLALGLPPRLPRFLGERPLPPNLERRILGGSVKFLAFVEKWVKPRRTRWMMTRPARSANALVLVLMALLLSLPFPGIPPFTNSLPCYAIILIAASMMEEDGVLIWLGYVTSVGTIIYLAFIAVTLKAVALKTWAWIVGLFS